MKGSPRLPLRERLSKAFRMVFQGTGGNFAGAGWLPWWDTPAPGSGRRWAEEVGNAWDNSVTSICLNWIQNNAAVARPTVERDRRDGTGEDQDTHPLLKLLASPNPYWSQKRLLKAAILSRCVDGNAYFIKARDGFGAPRELWWVPHWLMAPQWPQDGSEYISSYIYTVNQQKKTLPREDVVHWTWGVDPGQDRLGLSPIRAQIRHLVGDNEASTYTAAILRNVGVVGAILSPKVDVPGFTPDQAEAIKAAYVAKTTGDRRGEPMVLRLPMSVERGAMSPEDLMLRDILHYLEERICAAFSLSPIVLNLGTGLQNSTYANYSEAREAATENCILPLLDDLADTLTHQLLPDFRQTATDRLGWDYTKMRALQEDADKLSARTVAEYRGGLCKRGEGRAKLGYPVGPEDDVWFADVGGAGALALPPAAGAAAGAGRNGNGAAARA
jgi:HK97 family phage portal protein